LESDGIGAISLISPLSVSECIVPLETLLNQRLTKKQKRVVRLLPHHLDGKNMTHLAEKLSAETDISEPTVRRTLQLLRNLGIIRCGKGHSVNLTKLGKVLIAGGKEGGLRYRS